MREIKVLDVTLRDGGCVNDFNFGQFYINKILHALETSRVEIIEVGYLDSKNGSDKDRTQFINELSIEKYLLFNRKEDISYVAMMDYGKFDVGELKLRTYKGINGIRLAFHKEDAEAAIALGKRIKEKGYELYIQPMLCMRYSDQELLELIARVNHEIPETKAFYIVDSFGEMRGKDVIRIMNLVDHNLVPGMTLGFHSHNNLQLAYSNAMEFLNFVSDRDIILDASVMGMGKGAGNLNTELLLEHLNLFYNKHYQISPLLQVIDQVIRVLHDEFQWGYSVEYYLSSMNHCSPSYAKYFYTKHAMNSERLSQLLQRIAEEKRISFDEEYAEELYEAYNNENVYDDRRAVEDLQKFMKDKSVLVIAPGRSIGKFEDKIEEILQQENVVSISLNHKRFVTDFVMLTRTDLISSMLPESQKYIVPSNLLAVEQKNVWIINYERWRLKKDKIYDSAGIMVTRLLEVLNVIEVFLAGFDGFTLDVNENYYSTEIRRPITGEQAKDYNQVFKDILEKSRKNMRIQFVTDSVYEKD